jgi:hypothetical protein
MDPPKIGMDKTVVNAKTVSDSLRMVPPQNTDNYGTANYARSQAITHPGVGASGATRNWYL